MSNHHVNDSHDDSNNSALWDDLHYGSEDRPDPYRHVDLVLLVVLIVSLIMFAASRL